MIADRRRRRGYRLWSGILLWLAALSLPGCSYLEMMQRHRRLQEAFEKQPRLGLIQEFAPEQCLQVVGGLLADPGRDEPLAIIATSHEYVRDEVVGWRMVAGSVNYYTLQLPAGTYDLLVFADLDRDGFFRGNEVVGRTANSAPLSVSASASPDGFLVDGPNLQLDYTRPSRWDLPIPLKVALSSRILPSLEDSFFDPGYGVMGLYHPSKLLEHTQGYLFGLEPFDKAKTQVLFVHGIGGTPRDWTPVVATLDRSQFQPWFFFYPSGLPLDRTGGILAQLVHRLSQSSVFKPERLVMVAHSMGGLVARSALNRLNRDGKPAYLKIYISISTPYGGHDAARAAIEHAPEVVPSWYDVAPDSPFLLALPRSPLPSDLPFFLFFGYTNPGSVQIGPSSDGVVTIRSELYLPIHLQATGSFGFDASHTDILASAAVHDLFNQLIAPAAPPRGILSDPLGVVQRVLALPVGSQ